MNKKKTLDFKNVSYIVIALILALVAFKFFDYMEGKERRDRIQQLDYQTEKTKREIDLLNNYLDLDGKK